MKKIAAACFALCILLSFQNCSRHLNTAANKQKDKIPVAFTNLPGSDVNYQYIKNYFMLSEQRKVETWYNTYLTNCSLFYKIQNPTKDSIINLIKSYWVTSDEQKHDILSIQWRSFKTGAEVLITMNYSYRIIAENRGETNTSIKIADDA